MQQSKLSFNLKTNAPGKVSVVNAKVSELRKRGYQDLDSFLKASPNHVYVGRDMSRFVKGANGSKWKNPFRVPVDDKSNPKASSLTQVLEQYEQHIRDGPLFEQLEELQGQTLVCWCHPAPCHADVLKRLLEEKMQRCASPDTHHTIPTTIE